MAGLGGFIAYNEETGEPYMGLAISDTLIQAQLFLADRRTARSVVEQLVAALGKLATELELTEPKLVTIKGANNGEAFRKR